MLYSTIPLGLGAPANATVDPGIASSLSTAAPSCRCQRFSCSTSETSILGDHWTSHGQCVRPDDSRTHGPVHPVCPQPGRNEDNRQCAVDRDQHKMRGISGAMPHWARLSGQTIAPTSSLRIGACATTAVRFAGALPWLGCRTRRAHRDRHRVPLLSPGNNVSPDLNADFLIYRSMRRVRRA